MKGQQVHTVHLCRVAVACSAAEASVNTVAMLLSNRVINVHVLVAVTFARLSLPLLLLLLSHTRRINLLSNTARRDSTQLHVDQSDVET